ncbi:MAG: hypothetical protein Sylvanvirus2_23 [Sylvanvirus sp.]|uniref:Uncharacterized protein n=1 Tax=Sylvanvirus sp. TaxID=2487774 RepID=A0A3G5AH53_9VIRU|nr:MAG: hypothetical protein Sylvanvirus2_23 [Sylvanvirus sp.]
MKKSIFCVNCNSHEDCSQEEDALALRKVCKDGDKVANMTIHPLFMDYSIDPERIILKNSNEYNNNYEDIDESMIHIAIQACSVSEHDIDLTFSSSADGYSTRVQSNLLVLCFPRNCKYHEFVCRVNTNDLSNEQIKEACIWALKELRKVNRL